MSLQHGETDSKGEYPDNHGGKHHGEPRVHGVTGGKNTRSIRAQSKKTGVTQRDLPRISEEQVESQGEHGVDAYKNQDVHQVAPLERQGNHHHQ